MKTSRAFTSAIVIAMLALAACGGSEKSGSSGNRSTNGAEARKGGVLRIGTTDAITSFNPFIALSLQTGVALSMTYPSLLQLDYSKDKGYTTAPDLADSWEASADGKQYTFRLKANAKWSDGQPMTAEDAAWTINTVVKFQEGPTGQLISLVEGVQEAKAVDPTTLVVTYDHARGNALLLAGSGLPLLPKHVWEKYAEGDGRGLRTFKPEAQPGGMVSGGPYKLKEFKQRGTTAYIPNPNFYGPKSNAEAVALTLYTNEDAMIEDLKGGRLDVVESVPIAALGAVEKDPNFTIVSSVSGLQPDVFFNSNPRKPKNRELLDPKVKQALALCIDRQQIIDVILQGRAKPVDTLVGSLGGEFQNTSLAPRTFDCAKGNQLLDELGYKKGPDGIRVAPATTGTYAQPEHPMAYEVVTVANAGEYNVDRTVEILRKGWEQLGVKATQKVAGDETATNTYLTGANCDPKASAGYTSWDIDLSYSVAEIDPISTLSGELKDSWCAWNFTGFDNAEYDKLYEQAASEIDPAKRKQFMWRMQEIYYNAVATYSIAETQSYSAYSKKWDGFTPPESAIYTKLYYTAPHQVG